MTKVSLVLALVAVASSLWIGIQIDPKRDWIAWIFLAFLPLVFLLMFYLSNRHRKKKEHDVI